MWKILATSIAKGASGAIAFGFTLATPLATRADNYDNFIKTQAAEFEGLSVENCQEKKLEATEGGAKISYDLCVVKNSPIYLRTSAEGTPIGVSSFKKGKLVQLSLWEGTGGVGFRNEKPVVEWNSGEFSTRKVNWKLTAAEKAKFSEQAAKEKKILRKFGFR
jgi:hypothetical protein